jgi:hypothetical protein
MNANAGLPQSLGECRLVLDNGDFLDFRQPSSSVWLNGNKTVGSYTYTPEYLDADLLVRPIGDAIGKGICTVRHELEKIGQYEMANNVQVHLVKDTGTMVPCSNIWGQTFTPERTVNANAALICKVRPTKRFGKTIYI